MKLTDNQIAEYEKLKAQKQKQLDRQNKYVKEKYDRIGCIVPKGTKAEIEEHYKSKGFSSMSEYIVNLIKKDMQNTAKTL